MSGAAGHMANLWEDEDLTIGDVKAILSGIADASITPIVEKTDGANIMVTWSERLRRALFARNASDMKSGGVDASILASRFAGRPGIEEAYTGAVNTLNSAMSALPKKLRVTIFENGNLWFSVEVIHTGAQNVIGYDTNSVIFHSEGAKRVDKSGKIVSAQDAKSKAAILEKNIDAMQSAVGDDWRVRKDEAIALKAMADGTSLTRAIKKLDAAASAVGVDDSSTLGNIVKRNVMKRVATVLGKGSSTIGLEVVKRIIGAEGSKSVTQLKKLAGPAQSKAVQMLVDGADDMVKEAIQPIESAIIEFSIDALRGVSSAYMLDPESSKRDAQRISDEVAQAVGLIRSKGTPTAIKILDTQLRRLGDLTNAAISIEGAVFRYNDKTYKITASFGPVNQILGLFKYGRGAAAPPISRE